MYYNDKMKIDCDIPAGNIIVDRLDGPHATLLKDLRDTEGNWFYWKFRAFFDTPGVYSFTFGNGPAIGERGPAVSTDRGATWFWLGNETTKRDPDSFSYRYDGSPAKREVWFCMAIPYLQSNWEAFLAKKTGSPFLMASSLCASRKGRPVERLSVSDGRYSPAKKRLLLTSRNHACEMMATYVLEGILDASLEESPFGRNFRDRFETIAIPFIDKDGVEDGDQGKYRRPHDHNRDYWETPVYPETTAVMDLVRAWKPDVSIDLHCPWLHDVGNPHGTAKLIHILFPPDGEGGEATRRFGAALEKETPAEVPYSNADGLPFGTRWNNDDTTPEQGFTCDQWCRKNGVETAFCIEVPYAAVHERTFTPENARAFGKAIARSLLQTF